MSLSLAAISASSEAGTPRWEPLNEPGAGGWVVSIEVSPHDSQTMLVGGDVLGVGWTNDGGKRWERGVGLTCWEMGDFTWHPTNPKVVWVGSLAGPYESTDGGRTWMPKRNGFPPIDPKARFSAPIQKICYDPNNGRTLLAFGGNHRRMSKGDSATRFGAVWKSVDGGENWTRLTTIGDKGSDPADRRGVNLTNGGFAAGSSDTVYACSDDPESSGVYKSTDGGKSFGKANNGLPNTEVRFLALHPTHPNVLWAALGRGGRIYKSTDGAATWKASSTGMDDMGPEQVCGTIVVAPSNPNVLYTHGWRWQVPAPAYRSDDGGATWTEILRPGDRSTIIGGTAYTGTPVFKWMSVDPRDPKHVLALTEGWVLQSWDGGATWRDIGSHRVNGGWRGNGFGGQCATVIKWNPFRPQQLFTLGFDDGKLLRSEDGGWSWIIGSPSLATYNGARDVDFTRDGTIYVAFGQNKNIDNESIGKSNDWGKAWRYVPRPKGAAGTNEGVYALPDHPDAVWAITGTRLYKSADGGATWKALALRKSGKLYGLTADPAHPLTIYVGAQNGVYRSTDGAAFALMPGSPKSRQSTAVIVDPSTPGLIYAVSFSSGGQGVWRCDGAWTLIFHKPMAYRLAVDPGNSRRLAVLTKDGPQRDVSLADGVWLSEDKGAHWTQSQDGLGELRGSAIAFNPDKSGQLIVGTDGGGFYATDWGTSTPYHGVRSVIDAIQAEDYDLGGEGIAYHCRVSRLSKGDGVAYRKDAVDIRDGGSGRIVSGLAEGDWLKYRVNVPATGYYDAIFRAASANGGSRFHLTVNGVNVTGPVRIPSTGGAHAWTDVVAMSVLLHAGEQYLTVYVEASGADLDYIRMSPSGGGLPFRSDSAEPPRS